MTCHHSYNPNKFGIFITLWKTVSEFIEKLKEQFCVPEIIDRGLSIDRGLLMFLETITYVTMSRPQHANLS